MVYIIIKTIINLDINVPIPAPTNSNLGKPNLPYIKIQFKITLMILATTVEIIAIFVKDNPSENCLND